MLDDEAILQIDAPTDQAEEEHAEGDEPHAPHLEQEQNDDFAEKREIIGRVAHRQTGHRHGAGGSEERIPPTDVNASLGGPGQFEKRTANENDQGETGDQHPRSLIECEAALSSTWPHTGVCAERCHFLDVFAA